MSAPKRNCVDEAADLYVSSARAASRTYSERLALWNDSQGRLRGGNGRFLPRYNGRQCDRIGCGERVERRGRFCSAHRAEHGQRLLAQFTAIVDQHNARWGAS